MIWICHKIVNFSFLFGITDVFRRMKSRLLESECYLCTGEERKRKEMQQIEVDNLKWYVLYTAPRAEKQVENRIRGMGVICWLPLRKSPRAWSDRVKIVEMPLFPSYIFVMICTTCCAFPAFHVSYIIMVSRRLSVKKSWIPFVLSWKKQPITRWWKVKRLRLSVA